MMVGKIVACGEVGLKDKINEKIPDQMNFERGRSINK